MEAREQREGSRKGKPIKAPAEEPRDEEQDNLTDAAFADAQAGAMSTIGVQRPGGGGRGAVSWCWVLG